MKDNVNNYWGSAPDKGSLTGPVLGPLNGSTLGSMHGGNTTTAANKVARPNSDDFWLSSLGSAGKVSISVLSAAPSCKLTKIEM